MIVAVGVYNPNGGLSTVTNSYRDSFKKKGLKVSWILFGNTPAPEVSTEEILYVQLNDDWNYLIDRKKVDLKIKESISHFIRKYKPRFIFRMLEYAYDPYFEDLSVPQILIAQLLNAPLILSASQQNYFFHPACLAGVNNDLVRLGLENQAYAKAKVIISNSHTTKRDLERFYPQHFLKHGLCSPIGAQAEFFDIPDVQLNKNVLFFGRLTHQKGIAHLQKMIPAGWTLNVVGYGKWPKSEMESLGIKFHDWSQGKDLFQHIQTSTFCIFPSHYEPWGLSLNESLAAGRICIAQQGAGGHEEQIQNGKNGFLIDFNGCSFWDFIQGIWANQQNLLQVGQQAKLNARYWDNHFVEVCRFFETIY